MTQNIENSKELDVRPIPGPQRHPQIFGELEKLEVGESLIIKNDHDPVPLRFQVEGLFGQQFAWQYLEQGPEVFRLCFTRQQAASESSKDGQKSTFAAGIPVIDKTK